MIIDCTAYGHKLGSAIRDLVQILTLIIDQLYNLRQVSSSLQPSVSSPFFQTKSEKPQESSGIKTITTLWGSQPWPVEMDNFFSDGEIRESEHFHAKQDLSEAQIYALSYRAISTTLC